MFLTGDFLAKHSEQLRDRRARHRRALRGALPRPGPLQRARLQGALDLNTQYDALYGPGNYIPNLFVTYWSFRLMIGFLPVRVIMAVVALWNRVLSARWISLACLVFAAWLHPAAAAVLAAA